MSVSLDLMWAISRNCAVLLSSSFHERIILQKMKN